MPAIKRLFNLMRKVFTLHIEMGKSLDQARENSLVFFPYQPHILSCGISAFVAFKGKKPAATFDLVLFSKKITALGNHFLYQTQEDFLSIENEYLGGDQALDQLLKTAQTLKQESVFTDIFLSPDKALQLALIRDDLGRIITDQATWFKKMVPSLSSLDVEIISMRLEKLKDIFWCLNKEILDNIGAIKKIFTDLEPTSQGVLIFKRINAVLNSIDRLEVRGRDSAGISVFFTLTKDAFETFREGMLRAGLAETLKQRTNHLVLSNNSISINDSIAQNNQVGHLVTIAFVYKFAAEIGALGDNIAFIRSQIKNDHILQVLSKFTIASNSVSAHTRWASVGDITEANCHPVDNTPTDKKIEKSGIIHVCLNGDIDNYLELKTEYEARYDRIHPSINTDTKLIPLQIEHHLKQGASIEEAFRLAVNDFHGSHAISMHTNLAPGKLFLAQKGSGQAIFVGIAPDHYIAASELYGIVEETQDYIKLNGEEDGQIVILDQHSPGGVEGLCSLYYDSRPIAIKQTDIRTSQITSRDI
ncbi:MAG: glutamine--fructose-6-phosphate aminotransferase, partial [Proteobacteria bacterium]|nr:glutamine--fructose-6-phosphate aminotransferase [Pseudomonadota bacterium]